MKANIYTLGTDRRISNDTPIVVVYKDEHVYGTGYAGIISYAKKALKSHFPKACAGYVVHLEDEINGMPFGNFEKMYKA